MFQIINALLRLCHIAVFSVEVTPEGQETLVIAFNIWLRDWAGLHGFVYVITPSHRDQIQSSRVSQVNGTVSLGRFSQSFDLYSPERKAEFDDKLG